jgi:glycosyltransferase involved in cell wall biosynthesis
MSVVHPRVSVLLNVYNGEKYLRETMDSILAQTFTDFEFIIIDDGSTDGTTCIIKSYEDERISFIKNDQNCGVSASLNRGLSSAHGEYIAHTDCDDISSPDRLMTQVQFLDENPSIDIVGSWMEIIDQNSRPTGKIMKFPGLPMGLRWITFFNIPVAHPVVMMRRSIFDLTGQQYESEVIAHDYGLWTRLNMNILFSNIQSPLLKYRVHEISLSNSRTEQMNKEGCGISQKAISSYLGKDIPTETVKLIEQPYQAQSIVTFYSSIHVLHQVYSKFRKDYSLRPSEIIFINHDLANKLILISFKNHRFLSSWLLYFYALAIVIYTQIFGFVKNIQYELSRKTQRIKD